MSENLPSDERVAHGPEAGVTLKPIAAYAIAFALPCLMTTLCIWLCGASLALFLAGFFLLTPLLPPLLLTMSSMRQRLFIAACVVDGIAIVWLISALSSDITLLQWLRCYIVLIAYAAALAGFTITLMKLRVPAVASSAIAVIVSLAWLTWPVWFSPHMTNTSVSRVVSIHPLFAVNGALVNLGTWSHWPIAYRTLTTLGQDVPYTLPTSTWPAALLHLLAGCILCSLGLMEKK